jgi:hypothetical protein
MKAIWEKHKHFKDVYFLKLSDTYFIAKIIKPPYYDKWRVELFGSKSEDEFDTKQEAMLFVRSNVDHSYIHGLPKWRECQCYLKE